MEVLEWCLALGVRCLSVYAFSTENFKRTAAEVEVLFTLAEARLDEMAASPVIRQHRVRVQVLGRDFQLFPSTLFSLTRDVLYLSPFEVSLNGAEDEQRSEQGEVKSVRP